MKFSQPTTGSLILLDRNSSKEKDSIVSAAAVSTTTSDKLPQLIPMAMTKANSFPSSTSPNSSLSGNSVSGSNMNDEDVGDSLSLVTELHSAEGNGGVECEEDEEEGMDLDDDVEEASRNQSPTALEMEVSPRDESYESPSGVVENIDDDEDSGVLDADRSNENQKSSDVEEDHNSSVTSEVISNHESSGNSVASEESSKFSSFVQPEFRYVPPLTSHTLLKSGVILSDEKLNEYMIECVTCDQQFRLYELFNHAKEVHNVYTCVMCLSQFRYSRELMVHLHRAHRIMSQAFENPNQYLAAGGSRTYLSCVDCSTSFNLMSSDDAKSLACHECTTTKNSHQQNFEEATVSSEGCKSCGKKFSPSATPSKIFAHTKSCGGRAGLKVSENENRDRGTPPALRRESAAFPAVLVQRRKLAAMPELNPMVGAAPKKSNGWLAEDNVEDEKYSSRSDVEVTLINTTGGRFGGRETSRRPSLPSGGMGNKRSQLINNRGELYLAGSSSKSGVHGRKRTQAGGTSEPQESSAFYDDTKEDVSVTIVPVGENKASGISHDEGGNTGSVVLNGQLHREENAEKQFNSGVSNNKGRLDADNSSNQSSAVQVRGRPSINYQSASQRSRRMEDDTILNSSGSAERPRRMARKLTNDDFMYESVTKRSYQRAQSMTFGAPQPQPRQQRGGGAGFNRRPRNSISDPVTKGRVPSVSYRDDKEHLQALMDYDAKMNQLHVKVERAHMRGMLQQQNILGFQPKEEDNDEADSDFDESPIKLDPLLTENDPAKRLNMLIEELSSRLSNQWPGPEMPGYTRNEPDDSKYDITVNYRVENKVDDEVLAQMLSLTCLNCTYCRQVKLIKIDKRQLAVHLFSKHFWNLKFSSNHENSLSTPCTEPVKSEQQAQTDPSDNIDVVDGKNNSPTQPISSEVATPDSNQVPPSADSESVPNKNEFEKETSAKEEETGDPIEASTLKSSTSDNVKENETPNESAEESSVKDRNLAHLSVADQSEVKRNIEVGKESTDPSEAMECETQDSHQPEEHPTVKVTDALLGQLITNKIEENPSKEDMCIISWDDFKLTILRKVFQSKEVVFSYDNGYEFGEAPCECLLCGYSVESQKNLFPHWRKIHRGVAMKCAMCQGRFLFAGALFSHLCLGTPNPLVKNELSNGPSTAGGKYQPSQPDSQGKGVGGDLQMSDVNTEDGSADTIVLRYQCNVCRNLQLPGFFNYMVHMRKDHIRCELCLESMQTQKELEHHMKKHKLNHFCWKCGVTYCAKPNFMTHLFWKHGSESKECSVCLKKKWPHIYHFCVPPTHFVCDVCGFYFTKPKCLVVHKRLHSGDKKHKCSVRGCDQHFISKKLLSKHVQSAHNSVSEPPPPLILRIGDAVAKQEQSEETEVKPVTPERDVVDSSEKEIKEEQLDLTEDQPKENKVNLISAAESESPTEDAKPSLKLVIKTVPDKQSEEPEIKQDNISPIKEEGSPANISTGQCENVENEPIIKKENEDMEVDQDDDKRPFDLQDIQGPNLSEDETDGETEGGVHKLKPGGSRRRMNLRRQVLTAPKSPLSGWTGPVKNVTEGEGSPLPSFEDFMNGNMVASSPNEEYLQTDGTKKEPVATTVETCNAPVSVVKETESNVSECIPTSSPPVESSPPKVTKTVDSEKVEIVVEPSNENIKQLANDLVLSEDTDSASSTGSEDSDEDVGSKEENDSDSEDPKQKEEGKIAMTDLLDHCENLEKNLNQSAMDVEDPFKKVAALGLELNPTDLLEDPDKLKHPDDFGSMSPLLPPLDDFNFNVPDIPTFEDNTLPDHIIRENALFSVFNEHDYCLRQDSQRLPGTANHNRHTPIQSSHVRGHSISPRKKKKKSLKQRNKASKKDHSRKRHHSSSSSSSSSSSCSSCGSNCSCSSTSSSSSSSSSEDSSSDNEGHEGYRKNSHAAAVPIPIHLQHPSSNNSIPAKRGRGRPKGSINRNKDGIPTAKKWSKIKMSQSSANITHSHAQSSPCSQQSVNSDGLKPKRKYRKKKGLYTRKMSTHPEKENSSKAEDEQAEIPEENFTLETDLETSESGSEEVYSQKQLHEVIGRPSALDEIWTMSNEKYLLMMVKGVKELKDLQPPPRTNVQQQQQRIKQRTSNASSYVESKPTYSVQRATVPIPRLKVRNVPIKPLIVRRNPSVMSTPIYEHTRKPELLSPKKLPPNHSQFESSLPPRINGSEGPKIKLHISKKPNNMGSFSSPVVTSSATVSNHPQLGDRIPFVKLEDVSSKALEHGIVINPAGAPAPPVRRPKIKIGTGRGGKKTSTIVNLPRATPVYSVAEKSLESGPTNNTKEEVYCYCQCPHDNVSQMIGCDADDCEFQWFHFECVGVTIPPKGKWFCPDCKNKRKNKSAEQRKERTQGDDWKYMS